MLDGVLVIDKPAGLTSHQVVAEVSRRLGRAKTGHAGTLDPMATGVLVVLVGEATKIAAVLTADAKAYDGELELGVETDTLDAEGTVVRERRDEAAAVDRAALEGAMARLVGAGEQTPPMYSAIKQGGRRLHELARAGTEVERAPRPITIGRFDLVGFDPPRAAFAVDCSKGTYVRSLVADLGRALGCGAHLTRLRRTRSGSFEIARALPLAEVDPASAGARLVPLAEAVSHLPTAEVPADHERAVLTGKPLKWSDFSPSEAPPGVVALVAGGALLALAEVEPETGRVRYRRVFRAP
ncbi:MAG TPA: tRNA pseudouridine(55) synthase TruB [Kofleriaceae bacterium]|jgi:tRNA pseudouridine55 synthase